MWLQSQEGQELSVTAAGGQLILKMITEHKTVDHRNMIHGERSRLDFCSISHRMEHKNKQTLKTVLKRPMSLHRPWTRLVHLCFHNFGQKNHMTTCRVRRSAFIPVIRSKKHGYETSGLGFHQNTMTLHTRASRHMKFRAHT